MSKGLGSVSVDADGVGMHCVEIDICKLDVVMYEYCTPACLLACITRGDRRDAPSLSPLVSAIRFMTVYPSNMAQL